MAAGQIILLLTMALVAAVVLLLRVLPEHQRLAVTVARELHQPFLGRPLPTLVAAAAVLLLAAQ
jgi:hypothetical protein